ncbi:hypothetical protein J6590_066655 [Homalodisca vitripennis]|nr:hypothetical protein J6590_066655 [Homalodisca vitripennis]
MENLEVVEFEVKVNKWLNPEIRTDNLLAINCAELCKAVARRGGVPELIKQNKEESRYSIRSMVLIKSATATDMI